MSGVCRIMAAWAAAGAVENGGMLMYRYITKNKWMYVFYVSLLYRWRISCRMTWLEGMMRW